MIWQAEFSYCACSVSQSTVQKQIKLLTVLETRVDSLKNI